jgi:hypothetical protein
MRGIEISVAGRNFREVTVPAAGRGRLGDEQSVQVVNSAMRPVVRVWLAGA